MNLLFKYTSRSRPDNFFRGMDSIVNNLANKEDYHILCSFDVDDKDYVNHGFVQRLSFYDNTSHYFGVSSSKIDAINRDLPLAPPFDILVNFSDDQIFTQFGFDDIIRNSFRQNFNDLDGFLHFHDGVQPRLATMSIVGKKWFDRTSCIYHSSYFSEWCDNEEQEKAKRLGKYKYMGDKVKIMMHINPYHGKPEILDDLYKRNSKFVKDDKANYFKREALNFEL